MDFMMGLPWTFARYDVIWVIVDRLTKSAHFLPIWANYPLEKLAQLYIQEIVRLHGIPLTIISDWDLRFTSWFWGAFQKAFSTRLCLSTTFHLQMDGQMEQTIQILEDMLRVYIMEQRITWDWYLPLAGFAYNNSYHASIGMAPYELMYGWKCQSPLC